MSSRLAKLIRRRPWALSLAAVSTLVELSLAALWLQDRNRDWAEPALVLFGLLIVLSGAPSLKDLLADESEQKLAEHTVTYLENKGLFFVANCYEQPNDCYNSAQEVRKDLTTKMGEMDRETVIFTCADGIRVRCASFMRTLEDLGIHKKHSASELTTVQEVQFKEALEDLREDCWLHIGEISTAYNIAVRGELASKLPSKDASVRVVGGSTPNPGHQADG